MAALDPSSAQKPAARARVYEQWQGNEVRKLAGSR
jgi:hypothetical protein